MYFEPNHDTFFPNTHTHGKLSTLTMVTVLLTPSFAKHEDAQFSMMGFKALSLQLCEPVSAH
jgi:hypothetical protein